MINYNIQKAQDKVGGKYNLVLIAAQRARELAKGGLAKVQGTGGPVITAIKEIEEGRTGVEYLEKLRRK